MPALCQICRLLAPLAVLALAGPLRAEAPQSVATYRARIARIDAAGPLLRSVIALNPAASDEQAKQRHSAAPLAGHAVLVKDNIETADAMPTTAGSLALKDNLTGRTWDWRRSRRSLSKRQSRNHTGSQQSGYRTHHLALTHLPHLVRPTQPTRTRYMFQ